MSRANMLLSDHYEDYHASLREFRENLNRVVFDAYCMGAKSRNSSNTDQGILEAARAYTKQVVKDNT